MVQTRKYKSVLRKLRASSKRRQKVCARATDVGPVERFFGHTRHKFAFFERTHGTIRYGRENFHGITRRFKDILWSGPTIPGHRGVQGGAERGKYIESEVQRVLTATSASLQQAIMSDVCFPGEAKWVVKEIEERRNITIMHCQLPIVDTLTRHATPVDFLGVSIDPKTHVACLWVIELKTHTFISTSPDVFMQAPMEKYKDSVGNRALSQVAFAMHAITRQYGVPRDCIQGMVVHTSGKRNTVVTMSAFTPFFSTWQTRFQPRFARYMSCDAMRLRRLAAAKVKRAEKKRQKQLAKGQASGGSVVHRPGKGAPLATSNVLLLPFATNEVGSDDDMPATVRVSGPAHYRCRSKGRPAKRKRGAHVHAKNKKPRSRPTSQRAESAT